MMSQIDWIEQISQTPDRSPRQSSIPKVYPLITALMIGHSSSSAGTNDTSSRLDGTVLDTKDSGKCLPHIVGPSLSKDPSRLAPPWKRWEPGSNFLNDLQKWNTANKDRKLPAVLAKVNRILDSKPLQAALESIPNSPFPAKSLVKVMVSLFQLGSVSDVSAQIPATYPYSSYLIRLENSSGEAGYL